MLSGDQVLTLAFLTYPATHQVPATEIVIIETHLSVAAMATRATDALGLSNMSIGAGNMTRD
jgi:hypothetical protein